MFSHPRHSKWRGYVPNLQIKSQWQQNFFWINLWFANERQVHGEGEWAENYLLAFKYSGFWISDRVSASEFWQLRVSGREVAQGRLHPHDGHPVLLLLWQTPRDRRPLWQDQPPALCPLRGHHVHQVMLTIRIFCMFYRNSCSGIWSCMV